MIDEFSSDFLRTFHLPRRAQEKKDVNRRHGSLLVFYVDPSCPRVAMVPPVVKLYLFGTLLSVLALLYEMLDSFGGLMYVQDPHYLVELQEQTKAQQSQSSSCSQQRGSDQAKHINS